MKTVLVFPGQGTQVVGMGKDLNDNFAVARDVFEEVDDSLSFKLSKIIFEGPEYDLNLTENTQPALMAVSIAAFRVWLKEKAVKIDDIFSYVAGHSLGEYTALCASESISLADTARLLKIRGRSMQNACPENEGAMSAILGLNLLEVEEITKIASNRTNKICQIANHNSAEQVVISGHLEAVDFAIEFVKNLGKKAVKLKVSAPFHSNLVEPAAKIMQEALANINIKKPKIPLIANIMADTVENEDLIKEILVEQVTSMVKWKETMDFLIKNQANIMYEFGPGVVLSNLFKRHNPNAITHNIGKLSDFENNK